MESATRSPLEAVALPPGAQIASALELSALRWTSEQYAARLDQLARCMDRSLRTAQRCARALQAGGWAEVRPLLHGERSWVWLTEPGARLAGTGFRAWTPHLARLAHVSAVNEVRLTLADSMPEAVWICERSLARGASARQPRPDGALLCNGQDLAVEVELVAKTKGRLAKRLDALSDDYDALLYFCAPATYRQLTAIRSSGRWPSLRIRELPVGEISAQDAN